jgi:hypothetical protein
MCRGLFGVLLFMENYVPERFKLYSYRAYLRRKLTCRFVFHAKANRKCSGFKQVGGQFARKTERARRADEDGTCRT